MPVATSTSKTPFFYSNDGSGRDTFVNYAGAYWMNPLPPGTFFQSRTDVAAKDSSPCTGDTVTMGDSSAFPGRTLFGKSRYGTTVLSADQPGLGGSEDSTGEVGLSDASKNGTSASPHVDFNAEETALEHVPYDVSQPELRLRQPGHATTGLDGTGGSSTYNGVKDPWTAPVAVDNTLLRLAPAYESTCHYNLRTGRFYTEDAAPPHELTLPDKGVSWGKSRYY